MIISSKEVYDFYKNAFGRDSFNGTGGTMDAIFNRGNACPNASWNGTFISFCPGFTTDDVTAHEWSHAYTQYTHNLIYQWQPGALNESYSDIFGETIDIINGRDTHRQQHHGPAAHHRQLLNLDLQPRPRQIHRQFAGSHCRISGAGAASLARP